RGGVAEAGRASAQGLAGRTPAGGARALGAGRWRGTPDRQRPGGPLAHAWRPARRFPGLPLMPRHAQPQQNAGHAGTGATAGQPHLFPMTPFDTAMVRLVDDDQGGIRYWPACVDAATARDWFEILRDHAHWT